MNPFNAKGRPTDKAKLHHLSSGRAATNDMKDDLINVVSIRVLHHVLGQTNFGKSVKKIQPGKKRFEKPIKRNRLKISKLILKDEYPSERSESKRGFVYQGYMGMSCVFGSGAESGVGARDVISYDNGSSITCSY